MANMTAETGWIGMTAHCPIVAIRKGLTRFGSGDVLFAQITRCMEHGKSRPFLPGEVRSHSDQLVHDAQRWVNLAAT